MHCRLSLIALLFLSSLAAPQQSNPPTHPTKGDKGNSPPIPSFSVRPPSEEVVNSFMQQMFGYDPSVSWKVIGIKPAEAEGLSEVMVQVINSQGKQNNRLYVTAD